MKKNILFLLMSLLFTLNASAQTEVEAFTPSHWEPGMHLFAGGGLNSSLYSSEHERIEGGVGLNIKTDLVYFFNNDWAADWGSSVKFNRVDGLLIWDTQFTLGVRHRLPRIMIWNLGDPYVRAFIGKSPTVIFLDGDDLPSQQHEDDINRIQYDGSVYGLTFGNMATTQGGTIWFSEISASFQRLERASEIKMEGDVPVVMHEGPADANSNIFTVTFTIGALIF
jgi:hypothetical protein